jgi:uncharacterized protein YbaA (DUF1428 family)
MKYVDGFVLVVPKKELEVYRKLATEAGEIWRKHGALEYKECVGDDLRPNMGGMPIANFPDMVRLAEDELVIFSYIVFESRAHRDEVNAKVMADPFMNDPAQKDKPMPFDMKRMAYGGFEVLVEA